MNNQLLRKPVPMASQPFLAFLTVIGVILFFQGAPAVCRYVSASNAVPPSSDSYLGASEQIRNYRSIVAATVRGDVACSPQTGVPDCATVTTQKTLSSEAARNSARFAWVNLVLIRKELLGNAKAEHCIVRLRDRSGRVIAVVDHDTEPQFSRLPAEVRDEQHER